MLTTRPRGTLDVLPATAAAWQYVEREIRCLARNYGYGEIRTPIFEHTELFQRGVGETTDVVEKEMYTFTTKGERSLTLRAEGTAPAVRAFLENGLASEPQPTKLFYIAPIFRYEKPQEGRYRQHTQFGVEVFGAINPAVDAEVIALAMDLLTRMGITNLSVNINSIGCPKCRPSHRAALIEHFRPHLDSLCEDCQRRFEKNPLRLLDCKHEKCRAVAKTAPMIVSHLCDECASHFSALQEYLTDFGVAYQVNPTIVRGFDYYTKTVFEVISSSLGAQSTVCGGGRYDGLIETIGGDPTPGVGFGMGLERLMLIMERQGLLPELAPVTDVFIATVGPEATQAAPGIVHRLRAAGLAAAVDYMGRSVKGQFKYADKLGARFVAVLGDDELGRGAISVKEMASGNQTEVQLSGLAEWLRERVSLLASVETGEAK